MLAAKQRYLLLALLMPALAMTAVADRIDSRSQQLPRNGAVFIDRIDGFGPELEKAFLKEGVPWVIVSNRNSADFEISGTIRDIAQPGALIDISARDAEQRMEGQIPAHRLITLSIVNLKTKSVMWGYGVNGGNDLTDAAESCAKTVREKIRHKRVK